MVYRVCHHIVIRSRYLQHSIMVTEKYIDDMNLLEEQPQPASILLTRSLLAQETAAPALDTLLAHLCDIIERQLLTPVFQPIIDMRSGSIAGYEGLIRGPLDSPLHSPMNLFRAADTYNLTVRVEHLCRHVVLEHFLRMNLPGKLFLNVSPECLLHREAKHGETLATIEALGISPERIIIELTENQPTYDYNVLREAATHYRAMGFQIAIDDLGEGFSSLRLWSELRPEFVKIDKHFIQNISQDAVKLQFVRSIQEIAINSGSAVIAEGIETQAELLAVKDLGIGYGQGYFIARPHSEPATTLSVEVVKALGQSAVPVYSSGGAVSFKSITAAKLLRPIPPVNPGTSNDKVFELFHESPDLQSIPVVADGIPIGIINRHLAIERYARRYWRELYGSKPCSNLMDTEPVVVDRNTSVQVLSRIMVEANHRHMANGFIVIDQGKYQGVGTGQDLMAEITKLQIDAARYANPLTQLPGNVPINEHIDRLIHAGVKFTACYCDLDHFKPFNDVYGYRRGDDVIYLVSQILTLNCNSERDFVGHVGGDDFMILFQSEDWEKRCQSILEAFGCGIQNFFRNEDRERGGYLTEDRQGKKILCPLISLSLGAVIVETSEYGSHHQISVAMAEAKKQAKKVPGNALFVERRQDSASQPFAGPDLPPMDSINRT